MYLRLKMLAVALLIAGIFFYKKQYTSWTFILNAVYISALFLFKNYYKHFTATVFLIAYLIILAPFLVVNGFLTAIPVVVYNDAENLSIRIYTIPFEDIFYGMLLMLMNISLYEKLRQRKI